MYRKHFSIHHVLIFDYKIQISTESYINVGYHILFNMRNFSNKKVYVMMRAANDLTGNITVGRDLHDRRW